MLSRMLTGLAMFALAAGSAAAGGTSEPAVPAPASGERVPSLAAVYKPYFPIGAAVNTRTIVSQGRLLSSQVDSVTAENAMKWANIHPVPGNSVEDYNFTPADEIVAFAAAHHMLVRGHTLVWHQQVPSWVFSGKSGPGTATKEQVLERLRAHITTLLHHFRGQVYCWDVVNEAVSDGHGTWRTDSPWYETAGTSSGGDGVPDYIEKAFEYARAADPEAKLFYNDYNITSGPKLEHAYALVKALKAKGLIDGVGIQGHWQIDSVSPSAVGYAIERFASLGVQVQITELDLSIYHWGDTSSLPSLPADRERRQARDYGALFKVFREEAAAGRLTGVTFWGIADDHTWLDSFPVAGRKNWPLLFDVNHRPKPAFWAVVQW